MPSPCERAFFFVAGSFSGKSAKGVFKKRKV
jgi:hypothetical protein